MAKAITLKTKTMNVQELGQKCHDLRKAKGLKFKDLEARGINNDIVVRIEKAKRNYTISTLLKYMEACEIEISDLCS